MGHKVHPTGFRLGVVKGWQSSWFAERDYKDIWAEDFKIRQIINKELANALVSRIEIERTAADQVLVKVYTARPGIVIGKSGEKVDRLRNLLEAKTKKRRMRMDIIEIRQPELDAALVGRSIAEQLEKRVSFRRAMKQAVQKSMRANAKGIKVIIAGRLGGAEIARTEKEVEGKVPLQTLRADIDYGQAEAHTTFGVIGVKVWIYRGDILPTKRREAGEPQAEVATEQTFDRGDRRSRGDRQGGPRPQSPSRGGGPRGGEPGQRPQSPSRGGGPRGGEPGQRPQSPSRGGGPRGGEPGQRPPRQPGTPQTGGSRGGEGGQRPPRQPSGPRGGQRPPRQSGGSQQAGAPQTGGSQTGELQQAGAPQTGELQTGGPQQASTQQTGAQQASESGQRPPRQQPQHPTLPTTPPTPTTDNGNAGTTQNE